MKHFKKYGIIFMVIFIVAIAPVFSSGEWSYHGETGPVNWCHLDPAYQIACDGLEQSPINIDTDNAVESEYLPALQTIYNSSADLHVVNNGHTIKAGVVDQDSVLVIAGDEYKLLQFHFHSPSEHLIDGEASLMEMHLVHQSVDGTLAVVGVMINLGKKHRELHKIWQNLPKNDHDEIDVHDFNLNKILPADMESYRYAGSLTTPPCTEGVKWNVLAEPITMNRDQIIDFIRIFSGPDFPDGNRRPVQPLNGRVILTDED